MAGEALWPLLSGYAYRLGRRGNGIVTQTVRDADSSEQSVYRPFWFEQQQDVAAAPGWESSPPVVSRSRAIAASIAAITVAAGIEAVFVPPAVQTVTWGFESQPNVAAKRKSAPGAQESLPLERRFARNGFDAQPAPVPRKRKVVFGQESLTFAAPQEASVAFGYDQPPSAPKRAARVAGLSDGWPLDIPAAIVPLEWGFEGQPALVAARKKLAAFAESQPYVVEPPIVFNWGFETQQPLAAKRTAAVRAGESLPPFAPATQIAATDWIFETQTGPVRKRARVSINGESLPFRASQVWGFEAQPRLVAKRSRLIGSQDTSLPVEVLVTATWGFESQPATASRKPRISVSAESWPLDVRVEQPTTWGWETQGQRVGSRWSVVQSGESLSFAQRVAWAGDTVPPLVSAKRRAAAIAESLPLAALVPPPIIWVGDQAPQTPKVTRQRVHAAIGWPVEPMPFIIVPAEWGFEHYPRPIRRTVKARTDAIEGWPPQFVEYVEPPEPPAPPPRSGGGWIDPSDLSISQLRRLVREWHEDDEPKRPERRLRVLKTKTPLRLVDDTTMDVDQERQKKDEVPKGQPDFTDELLLLMLTV